MVMKSLLSREELPKAFIFDFDGTLCDVRGILHHIDRSDQHLSAFHEATHTAPENEVIFALLRQVIDAGITPLLLSARGERWRAVTVDWLGKRDYVPEIFYMRDDDDLRTGAEVKRDILRGLEREWNIVGAVDDDPKVVEMWESEGVPTILVPGYNGTDDPSGVVIPEWWSETIIVQVSL
jgi:phosphoglycolate phosphatase-like HAD superfamily hydrolase